MALQSFKILPYLGRKTDVSPGDPSLMQVLGEGVALTHDVGGVNFDITRKPNSCSKSKGYSQWSLSATAQATKCLGLFELYDGSSREHIYVDNGVVYVFDAALDPIDRSGAVSFGTNDADLMSFIRLGGYAVFTDRAGTVTPYKWASGDAAMSKLIASGTEYKFRYLEQFQRRVIGAYSDQANGDIEIRWSTDFPTTAVASLNFPALNQLFIPNDDPIVGIRTMGHDRCYIYCEDSIQQLVYYPDYNTPFRIFTIVPQHGAGGHQGIVNLGNRHFMFNRFYGFCEYQGGSAFPYGGKSISNNIEDLLQTISPDYYNLIVGVFIPLTREIVWTVPLNNSSTPNYLLFYNVETGQWRYDDKVMRYVDNWRMTEDYAWADFVADIGGTGIWSDAGANSWAYFATTLQRLVMSNTDGKLYFRGSDGLAGSNIDGYRIEPIMDFGIPFRQKVLEEIWFGIDVSGSFSIDVYYRGGNTVGEVENETWVSIGSISCNSIARPVLMTNKTDRYMQIKWGTNLKDEDFRVSDITFKFAVGSDA